MSAAEIEGATAKTAASLLHADVSKRPQHGACHSRGQQGAIRQPQAAFEVGRRLPHAQYLATGNDARHRRGLKIAHRHLEGWHHQGEALRDAGGYPHGIVEHGAYEPPCTTPARLANSDRGMNATSAQRSATEKSISSKPR